MASWLTSRRQLALTSVLGLKGATPGLTESAISGMLLYMNVYRSRKDLREGEPSLFRLGPLMHAYRLAAGKTQTELAQSLGVAVTRVNAIERGRAVGPGADIVARLEPLLRLTPQQASLMRAAAARDRVLLAATRTGLSEGQIAFLAAGLDAAIALGSQELDDLRQGLAAQVQARQKTSRFLGQPTLSEANSRPQQP